MEDCSVKPICLADEILMQEQMLVELNSGLDGLLSRINGEANNCAAANPEQVRYLKSVVTDNSAQLQLACKKLKALGTIIVG